MKHRALIIRTPTRRTPKIIEIIETASVTARTTRTFDAPRVASKLQTESGWLGTLGSSQL